MPEALLWYKNLDYTLCEGKWVCYISAYLAVVLNIFVTYCLKSYFLDGCGGLVLCSHPQSGQVHQVPLYIHLK